MTIQTVADMVWALGFAIKVVIYDPAEVGENHPIVEQDVPARAPTAKRSPPATSNVAIRAPIPRQALVVD